MIGLAFIVFVIGGMFYSLIRDGDFEDAPSSFKWMMGIIGAVCLAMLLFGLFGDSSGYKGGKRYKSPNVEYCTSGSYLDKFGNGGSQWRNPNGRFCRK